MLTEKLHEIGSLALIRALPELLVDGENIKHGRLKNLLGKLEDSVDTILTLQPRMSCQERHDIALGIKTFREATDWTGAKHTRTYTSFIILIASKNKWRKIEDIIKDIVEFQERKTDTDERLCDDDGQNAFDIWEGLKS